MSKEQKDRKLTGKEREVLDVFLAADTTLTASEVHDHSPSLNMNTIQAVLRSLLKAGYIEVAEIVYSGTVLCRRYGLTDLSRKASIERLSEQFNTLRKHIPAPTLIATLIENFSDNRKVVSKLEEIIKALREEIGREG